MEYKQTVAPNPDPILRQGTMVILNWVGWCLLYVQTAFGASWAGSTAWDGWLHRLKYKHAGQPPKGVYVPLWFSGYHGMGHVLIAKFNADGSGTAWTSPNDIKATADTIRFSSLSNLMQQLKADWSRDMEYAGWSEDIGGVRIIQPVTSQSSSKPSEKGGKFVTPSDLNYIYQYGPLGRRRDSAKKEGENVYLGKTASFVIADHLKSKEYKGKKAREQATADNAAKKLKDLESKVAHLQGTGSATLTPAQQKKIAAVDAFKAALSA